MPTDVPNPENDPKLFERIPVDPEIKEWALAQFSEEEVIKELDEVRRTGGLKFEDILAAFDEAVADDERAA
jgi:hypothetical protein